MLKRTDNSIFLINKFVIKLNEDSSWELIANLETSVWLQKFAAITKATVKDGVLNGHKEIYFVRCSAASSPKDSIECAYDLSRKKQNLPLPKFIDNDFCDPIICEIDPLKEGKFDFQAMRYVMRIIHRKAIEDGGLPFHAALVTKNGNGFLIAGKSGAGKSTCCQRIPYPWNTLCDDEALIVKDKKDDKYYCHPLPTWSDYLENRAENTWDVQYSVPLKAIFNVEQAETDQTLPLGLGIAATGMYESAAQICMRYWFNGVQEESRREKRLVFENACDMAKKIPAYTLRATLNGRFWEEMERVIDEL